MSGPWEKYAKPEASQSQTSKKPWEKYSSETEAEDEGGMTLEGLARGAVQTLPAVGGVAAGFLGAPLGPAKTPSFAKSSTLYKR